MGSGDWTQFLVLEKQALDWLSYLSSLTLTILRSSTRCAHLLTMFDDADVVIQKADT